MEEGELTMPSDRDDLVGGGTTRDCGFICEGRIQAVVLDGVTWWAAGGDGGVSSGISRVESGAHAGPLRADVAQDLQVEKFDCEILQQIRACCAYARWTSDFVLRRAAKTRAGLRGFLRRRRAISEIRESAK